ncbi:hypothetical protein [Halotia branconii]|uniref:Uncharacterized protein n=1 Tax=Halotia branconii CENA392 TaxID=1539056 RepID=A0AAJ6NQE2_9CYAN|nr:hypothetical protein [Halotia branconii]WGV24667.1 hypothetical protein QI031_23295 [Halotia branconii CENA392]
MSTLMISELLADLSPEQQQLLAGGADGSEEPDTSGESKPWEDDSDDDDDSYSMLGGKSGVYLIKSKSIVRVRKLKKS